MNVSGIYYFVLIFVISYLKQTEGRIRQKIICQGNKGTISCNARKRVLNIVSSTYGRTNLHTCRSGPIGTMNCGSRDNALSKTKSLCQGKKQCKIFSSNTVFQDPCPGTAVYLTVQYTCVRSIECKDSEFACADKLQCIASSKKCDGRADCVDGSDENNCASGCGVQAIQPDIDRPNCKFRIVGGCTVRPEHSWPWVLQLIFDLENNGVFEHECGAALISESYAITASHCFLSSRDTSRWKVVAGRHKKTGSESTHQVRKISKLLPYPNPLDDNYNPLDKDLTLIKFDQPVTYNDYVSPVCLPERAPVTQDLCIVAGWGEVDGTGGGDVLKNTLMPIVNTDKCNGSDALGDQITEYMFCAGFQQGGNDACQGDSGGPLMCKINNVWVVSGLVSWGIECAKPAIPGVYANVYKFVQWINQQMSVN